MSTEPVTERLTESEPHSRGLSLRLFGREARRLGVHDEALDARCQPLAEKVIQVLEVGEHAQFGLASNQPWPLIEDSLDALRLEHRDCGYWPRGGGERCYVPSGEDRGYNFGSEDLIEILGERIELLLDFVSIYLQFFDTEDWTDRAERLFRNAPPIGFADNKVRRAHLLGALNATLRPEGFKVEPSGLVIMAIAGGTAPLLDRPVLAALDNHGWSDVADRVNEASREIEENNYADALTDAGTAMEIALRLAGFPERTLGHQISLAKKRGLFASTDAPLGEAIEQVVKWLAAMRNTKGDAHDTPHQATRDEAELALRLVLSVSAWLASRTHADS